MLEFAVGFRRAGFTRPGNPGFCPILRTRKPGFFPGENPGFLAIFVLVFLVKTEVAGALLLDPVCSAFVSSRQKQTKLQNLVKNVGFCRGYSLDITFKEKLALKLQQNKTKSKIVQKVETSVLKKEMQLYEDSKNDGTRPHHLELLYIAMLNVTPTSVESERAFSSAGLFVTKIRSRLGDSTVNMLVFMRDYLKRHQ